MWLLLLKSPGSAEADADADAEEHQRLHATSLFAHLSPLDINLYLLRGSSTMIIHHFSLFAHVCRHFCPRSPVQNGLRGWREVPGWGGGGVKTPFTRAAADGWDLAFSLAKQDA